MINFNSENVKKLISVVKQTGKIKVKELVKILNCNSRVIRAMRETISNNPQDWDCIIGENSRDGYYICDTEEKLKQYINDMRSRIIAYSKQIKNIEKFYYEKYNNKIEQLLLEI